jgi:hypothetical protein
MHISGASQNADHPRLTKLSPNAAHGIRLQGPESALSRLITSRQPFSCPLPSPNL